jgi:hypothetical protein
MKHEKYRVCTSDNDNDTVYLEMDDLTEASIQIWEEEGTKKAFIRIKLNKVEIERIIDEYQRIQALQKVNK